MHIRLSKAAINRLAFLVYCVVDSVGLGRDQGLRYLASNRTVLLVAHNDLVLTLCNGHWRLYLARRGTRGLTSGLICSIPLVIVALSRY